MLIIASWSQEVSPWAQPPEQEPFASQAPISLVEKCQQAHCNHDQTFLGEHMLAAQRERGHGSFQPSKQIVRRDKRQRYTSADLYCVVAALLHSTPNHYFQPILRSDWHWLQNRGYISQSLLQTILPDLCLADTVDFPFETLLRHGNVAVVQVRINEGIQVLLVRIKVRDVWTVSSCLNNQDGRTFFWLMWAGLLRDIPQFPPYSNYFSIDR